MADAIQSSGELSAESTEQLIDTDLSEDPKSISDSAKTSNDELFTESELGDDLDLEAKEAEKSKRSSTAELNKEKQINSWAEKIARGDKQVSDIPKNISWLRPEIERRILLQQREPDLDEMIERKLVAKDQEFKFKEIKERLNELDLTKSQQKELSQEFRDLLDAGVPRLKALEKAMKIAGISLIGDDAKTSALFKTMTVKGGRALEEDVQVKDLDENKLLQMKQRMPLNERIGYYESLRKTRK